MKRCLLIMTRFFALYNSNKKYPWKNLLWNRGFEYKNIWLREFTSNNVRAVERAKVVFHINYWHIPKQMLLVYVNQVHKWLVNERQVIEKNLKVIAMIIDREQLRKKFWYYVVVFCLVVALKMFQFKKAYLEMN